MNVTGLRFTKKRSISHRIPEPGPFRHPVLRLPSMGPHCSSPLSLPKGAAHLPDCQTDHTLSLSLSLWLNETLESPLDCKKIQPVYPKGDQSWMFIGRTDVEAENSNTLATWCEELTHLKRPWCWERLKAGGEGDNREWDGWMASLIQWTWVRAYYGSWWWTGKPGML